MGYDIERANQELQKALKRMAGKNLDIGWDFYLSSATRALNTRLVVAVGYTPFEILFAVQPRMLFELAFPDETILGVRSFLASANPDNEID